MKKVKTKKIFLPVISFCSVFILSAFVFINTENDTKAITIHNNKVILNSQTLGLRTINNSTPVLISNNNKNLIEEENNAKVPIVSSEQPIDQFVKKDESKVDQQDDKQTNGPVVTSEPTMLSERIITFSPHLTVFCFDILYGQKLNPTTIHLGNGKVTFYYKVQGASDDSYTTVQPTNAGKYTIKATIEKSGIYREESVSKNFEIKKAKGTFVKLDTQTIAYKDNLKLSDVKLPLGYEWLASSDTALKFEELQSFKARYTDPSNNYTSAEGYINVYVKKADFTPIIICSDVTYGMMLNPKVSNNLSGGKVTYLYKPSESSDSAYTTKKPQDAGEYTIKVIVSATKYYNEASATSNVTIKKAKGTFINHKTITITYQKGLKLDDITLSNNYEWINKNTLVGAGYHQSFKAKYTHPSNNYTSAEGYVSINVKKADFIPTIICPDITYGMMLNPKVSNNLSDGKVTYLYKPLNASDKAYTTKKPQNVGEYTIKVIVSATKNYNEASATTNFTITKAKGTFINHKTITITYQKGLKLSDITLNNNYEWTNKNTVLEAGDNQLFKAKYTHPSNNYTSAEGYVSINVKKADFMPTVTCPDIIYGKALNPKVSNNLSGGKVTYLYKPLNAPDRAYTTKKPQNAGEYTIKVIVSATKNYNESSATANFTIKKAKGTFVNHKTITITYREGLKLNDISLDNNYEWTNKNTLVEAGYHQSFKAKYTHPSNNYTSAEGYVSINVKKGDFMPTIVCPDITYGMMLNPKVSNNLSDGKVTYLYKPLNAPDKAYTTKKPHNAGEYTIKVIISSTKNYNEASATANFNIHKAKGLFLKHKTITITYREGLKLSDITLDNNYEWTDNNVLLEAGDKQIFKAKYTHPSNNYTSANGYVSIDVKKADFTPTIICSDIIYGELLNPEVANNVSNGEVSFQYKLLFQRSNEYSNAQPTDVGDYIVKATISETKNYNSATVTTTFSIKKATPIFISTPEINNINIGTLFSEIAIPKPVINGANDVYLEGVSTWESNQAIFNNSGAYSVLFKPNDLNHESIKYQVQVKVDTTLPKIKSVTATQHGANSALLKVEAISNVPLSYQWQVKGSWIDIEGGTTSEYIYSNLEQNKEYTIRVIVTDKNNNQVISDPVSFTLKNTDTNIDPISTNTKQDNQPATDIPKTGAELNPMVLILLTCALSLSVVYFIYSKRS